MGIHSLRGGNGPERSTRLGSLQGVLTCCDAFLETQRSCFVRCALHLKEAVRKTSTLQKRTDPSDPSNTPATVLGPPTRSTTYTLGILLLSFGTRSRLQGPPTPNTRIIVKGEHGHPCAGDAFQNCALASAIQDGPVNGRPSQRVLLG